MLKEEDTVTSFKMASSQLSVKLRTRHGHGDYTFHSGVCMV